MKYLSLLVIALAMLISCNKSTETENKSAFNDYKAEISGLPETMNISTKLLNYTSPSPKENTFTFYLANDDESVKKFKELLQKKTSVESISFQVHVNDKESENINMNNTEIVSIDLIDGYLAIKNDMNVWETKESMLNNEKLCKIVRIYRVIAKSSNNAKILRGQFMNPGASKDAPEISEELINSGWLHADGAKTGEIGLSIQLNDYSFNKKAGILDLGLAGNNKTEAIKDLISQQTGGKCLILILPEKSTKKYIEYKIYYPVLQNISSTGLIIKYTNLVEYR